MDEKKRNIIKNRNVLISKSRCVDKYRAEDV